MNTIETTVKEVLNEERKQQSSPFIASSHNFKIDMPMFMHAMANCVKDTKQFSIIYKILKDVDGGSVFFTNRPCSS